MLCAYTHVIYPRPCNVAYLHPGLNPCQFDLYPGKKSATDTSTYKYKEKFVILQAIGII